MICTHLVIVGAVVGGGVILTNIYDIGHIAKKYLNPKYIIHVTIFS